MKNTITLAVRIDCSNPLHHLWNNNGTWWCHLTLHCSDGTAERKRFSLRTSALDKACRRRDAIIAELATRPPTRGSVCGLEAPAPCDQNRTAA